MTVFLQAKFGEVINPNVFAAYWGFSQRGFETRKFESIEDATLTSTDIVCGNIGVVQNALKKIGVSLPAPIDIPDELFSFCKRKIYNSTIQEIHRTGKWPVFIKPKNIHKLFNGHVISHERDLIYTSTIPDDCEVIVSEVLNFQTEYRVFVLDEKMLGARCYQR